MQWIARFSRTHILIALVSIFAFISTYTYLQSLDDKMMVARLSKNINSGQSISKDDVKFVEVSYDKNIASELIRKEDLDKQPLIARIDLSISNFLSKTNTLRQSSEFGHQSLSIGIDIDRANGGDIRKGDVINIWQTGEFSKLVAKSVSVRNVILPNKRLGISTTKTITVVVAVDPDQAEKLSYVIGSKDLMLVLANGNPGNTEVAPLQQDDSSYKEFEPINVGGN